MLAFLASFRDLCLFRRGPEDMPYAPRLLAALLVASIVVQTAFDIHFGAGPAIVVAVAAGWLAMLALLHLLLRGRGMPERFVQAATALVAVKLVLDVIVYPLALSLPLRQILAHPTSPASLTGFQGFALVAVGALGVWQLCVWTSIYRRSLGLSLPAAILVLLLTLFVNWLVAGVFGAIIGGLA